MSTRILLAGGPGGAPGFIDWSRAVAPEDLGSDQTLRSRAYVVIADGQSPGDVHDALLRIRQHPMPGVYLTPVVLASAEEELPPALSGAADFVWDRDEDADTPPEGVLTSIKRIDRVTSRYSPASREGDRELAVRILRFMSSRPGEFEPERTPRRPAGFVYRRLDPFLNGATTEIPDLLEALESRRLLRGSFVTNAYFCRHCTCAFLNFEETCPECGSSRVEADDWIHHFRCAYTGPRSEFADGSELTCPDCGRALRQVGVDYDRPSVAYSCLECSHSFEEPDVTATCYDCGRTAPPAVQERRTIESYTVTALGENTARHGLDRPFVSAIQRHQRALEYDTFRTVVEGEAARLERYDRPSSSLLLVLLRDVDRVQVELGVRAQEVFQELTDTFTRFVRASDFITARTDSLFLILLTETEEEDARSAEQRLREGVQELLEGNLEGPPRMRTDVRAVTAELDMEEAVETFLEGGESEASEG
mgnify:CR=1 FL=1